MVKKTTKGGKRGRKKGSKKLVLSSASKELGQNTRSRKRKMAKSVLDNKLESGYQKIKLGLKALNTTALYLQAPGVTVEAMQNKLSQLGAEIEKGIVYLNVLLQQQEELSKRQWQLESTAKYIEQSLQHTSRGIEQGTKSHFVVRSELPT